MAAISAPPALERRTRSSFLSKSSFLGFADFSNARHVLKLRQNFKASDALRIELGLNFDITRNVTSPWAGVRLLLDGTREDSWAVEVASDMAVLCTPKFDLLGFTDRASLPIDARLGKDFLNDGSSKSHVEVGIHNPIMAATLLVAALSFRLPIDMKRKEAGGFAFGVPISFKDGRSVRHTAHAKAEVDATLARTQDRGLKLMVHQLNGVLRLRQDD